MDFEQKAKDGLICFAGMMVMLVIVGWFVPLEADTVPVENGNTLSGWHWEQRSYGYHRALDFPANKYTPVKASVAGRVINADYDQKLGNYVDIFDGTATYRYGHLQAYFVNLDEYIAEGQVFASVGSTGTQSIGPHLHYAVKQGGKFIYVTDRFDVKFKLIQNRLQK